MRLTVCIFVLMASCSVLAKKSNYWWMFPKFDEHSPDHQLESAGVPDDLDESSLLPLNNNASLPYLKPIDGSYDEKEQNDEEIREEEEDEDAEQEELQGEEGALALNEELDDADLDLDQDQDKEELLILKENGVVDWKDLLDDMDENENKSGSEEKAETKNTVDEGAEEDDSSSEEDEEEEEPTANKKELEENDTMEVSKKLQAAVQKAIEEQEGSGKEPEGSGESEPEGSGENQDTTDDEKIESGQVEPRSRPDTSNTDIDDDSDNMFDDLDDDDDDDLSESSTEQDVKEPAQPSPRLDPGQDKNDLNVQPLIPEFQQPLTTTCDFKQSPLIPLADPKFITELPGTDSLLICRLMPGQYNATLPAFRVTWSFEKAACPKGAESSCRVVLNTTIYDSPTGPNNLTYVVAHTLLKLNHSDVGEYTCEVDFYGCPPQTSINATRMTSQPINVRLYEKPDYAVHIGVISAACVILFVILAGLCYFVWKQEKAKEGNYKMLLATTNVEYAPSSKMLQPPNSVYNPTTTNTVGFTKMSSVSSFGSKSSFSSNEEFQEP